jgi:hypothetical protein
MGKEIKRKHRRIETIAKCSHTFATSLYFLRFASVMVCLRGIRREGSPGYLYII